MKNNRDIFIKYLDNQLSNEQRKEFEQRLNDDHKLNLDFIRFSESFQLTKKTFAVDERYFETLLPNVRESIRKSSPSYFGKMAYIFPVVIIGLFIFYIFNMNITQTDNSLTNISELIETDVYLSDEDLMNVIDLNRYVNLDDKILEIYFNDYLEMDETLFEYLELNLAANEISNSFLEELSENEFSKIYKELENKNIIGEK